MPNLQELNNMELYLKVGDKLIKVDRIENNVPIIKTESEETRNSDETKNCTVKVPCLQIAPETETTK